MTRKHKIYIAIGAIIAVIISVIGISTFSLQFGEKKPLSPPPKPFAYYEIIDIESGKSLMFVPITVSIGDEVISEENKRYQVVRLEKNRAYARFVEYVNLEKYVPSPQK